MVRFNGVELLEVDGEEAVVVAGGGGATQSGGGGGIGVENVGVEPEPEPGTARGRSPRVSGVPGGVARALAADMAVHSEILGGGHGGGL